MHGFAAGELFLGVLRTNIHWHGYLFTCHDLQANHELQQQMDMLHQEASDKSTSFSNQAQALEAEKAALQQDLTGLALKLKAAESGQSELQEQQELWKSKCSKYLQVCFLQTMSSAINANAYCSVCLSRLINSKCTPYETCVVHTAELGHVSGQAGTLPAILFRT